MRHDFTQSGNDARGKSGGNKVEVNIYEVEVNIYEAR